MKAGSSIPAKRKKAKRPSVKSAVDAFARTRIPAAVPADPFGKLRGLLARLNAWDGSASKCPDINFCFDLNFAIVRAAWSFRVRKKPSLPEAVSYLHRREKKLGVRRALDDAEKKLRALSSRKPLIRVLMDRSRRGDTDAKKLLSALRQLDECPKLLPFRKILSPESSDKSRPNLLAAAWRARWEYSDWLADGEASWLAWLLGEANSPEKNEDKGRGKELARKRQARKRAAQKRSTGIIGKLS